MEGVTGRLLRDAGGAARVPHGALSNGDVDPIRRRAVKHPFSTSPARRRAGVLTYGSGTSTLGRGAWERSQMPVL